jgi:NAD(P)-dependent dehydrogenase (short-subunit alcohol dehydrogenase family)
MVTCCPQGFGWAIAKALAEAGAEISLGVWVSSAVPRGAAPAAASVRGLGAGRQQQAAGAARRACQHALSTVSGRAHCAGWLHCGWA